MVSFGEAVKLFFTKAFDYSTRATRAEYWWVYLFNVLLSVAFSILALGFGIIDRNLAQMVALLSGLVSFVLLVPYLSLTVRRLHDIGKSGKWLLIPVIFNIVYVVTFVIFFSQLIALTLASSGLTGASGEMMNIFGANALILAVLSLVLIGVSIWFFVWSLLPSQPGQNKWGASGGLPSGPAGYAGAYGVNNPVSPYANGAPYVKNAMPLDYSATSATQVLIPAGEEPEVVAPVQRPVVASAPVYPPGHPLAGQQAVSEALEPSGYVRPVVEPPLEIGEVKEEVPEVVFPVEGYTPPVLTENPFRN